MRHRFPSVKLSELDIDSRVVALLREQGIAELYPPQAEAAPIALSGKNLVLAVPTASGKSLVAYLAMLKSVLEKDGKCLYIVPLRALAGEKFDDLKKFESLGVRVTYSVGDLDTADPKLGDYDIVICTSEKADSLLRHKTDWLKKISVVVADEVHLITDPKRGPTLEVTLARFRQINKDAQIVALSATIENSGDIALWLDAKHVKSEWRPVPLKCGVYLDGKVSYSNSSSRPVAGHGDEVSKLVMDTLKRGYQAMVFLGTRASAEKCAEGLAGHVSKSSGFNSAECAVLAADILETQDEPTRTGERLAECVKKGTAFHHAGLSNEQRKFIEENFKKGRIKCITATPTLCLAPDTLITTLRGPVRISEVTKDDYVMTHTGKFRKVLGISRRFYDGEMLRIKADGMLPVLMTPEHKVLVNVKRRIGSHSKKGTRHKWVREKPIWKRADEIDIGDDGEYRMEVQTPIESGSDEHITLKLYEDKFIGRNQFGAEFPHPHAIQLPKELFVDERVAKFIGLYAAEGFTGRNGVVGFAVASYETELRQFITDTMKEVFNANPTLTYETRHRLSIRCCSRAMAKYFDENFGRGAKNKHLPEYFMSAPLNTLRGFICGMWLGDGSYSTKDFNTCRYTTISPRLAEQLNRMLKRLGYVPSIVVRKPRGMGKHDQCVISLSGEQGARFLTDVMKINHEKVRHGNRTYNTKGIVDGTCRSPIRSIYRVKYEGFVYNLHIEDDESYVCSFGFTVHNSAGVNLPSHTVIVRDLYRYDPNLGRTPIPVLEIQQMMGRAGRPRYDKEGEAILIAKTEREAEAVKEHYINGSPENILSKLGNESALRTHVLSSIATRYVRTREELKEFMNHTFYAMHSSLWGIETTLDKVIEMLAENGMISDLDGKFNPTLFGERVSDLYIDPLSAVAMRKAIAAAKPESPPFGFLHAVCATPDMLKLYVRRGDAWIEDVVARAKFLIAPPDEALSNSSEYEWFLAEVKTASLVFDWMNSEREESIEEKYSVGPGDIRNKVEIANWLLYSIGELARIFKPEVVGTVAKIIRRVKYGVKEELLPLIDMDGVGRIRAMRLYGAGFKTPDDVAKADLLQLSSIVGIGPVLARKLKKQTRAEDEKFRF